MEIQAASVDQMAQARDGRWVAIDADVGSVASLIKEIGDTLGVDFRLHFSERTGIFKVVQFMPDGEEQLVTTATELDGRLVNRLREITSESYDLAAEAEKVEEQARKDFEHAQAERIGEVGERLAHAIRTDLGERKTQVTLPRGVNGSR
jgi:hypothetical protein